MTNINDSDAYLGYYIKKLFIITEMVNFNANLDGYFIFFE